ncbi:vegetative incompatibility protein HET-E-1, putative [Rhizoctonia solani AG-3 Rhs1AP]|uniref:Vegetative incompatibility protein HET-E-1, putative n=2 Tax=Rhizoctonia solani AG-3 TaxID=1086053 RepID=X8IUZ2_9AGAM|nr:vegetative incompatibility protein HET-E-1, putative [Rhizoctonia solani AG-3 Rhs1AP]KEP52177.1 putative vegetative incompatibility protein HET-E-1 [Rhizoctonia solani 123E]
MSFRDKFHEIKFRTKAKLNGAFGTQYNTRSSPSNLASPPSVDYDESERKKELPATPLILDVTPALPEDPLPSWTCLKTFLRMLEPAVSVFEPLYAIVKELVQCIEIYEEAANGRKEYEELRNELGNIFNDLRVHYAQSASPAMTASIESLCGSIHQELVHVQRIHANRKKHPLAVNDVDEILACYNRIRGHLQRLTLNANLAMWRIAEEQATAGNSYRLSCRLDRLSPSLSARYNSAQALDLNRGECIPSTRREVLEHIRNWAYNTEGGSTYWLNGMAGTGKTTIAYSTCAMLDTDQKLVASFFCSRQLPECRNTNLIIPTIAYQIARFSRPFQSSLSRVLEQDPDVHTSLPHIQFEELIAKPLAEAAASLPTDLVIVIDALDECENKEGISRILEILLAQTSSLPIKFFVSSRPEPEIREYLAQQTPKRQGTRLVLHELDGVIIQADIERYLRSALAFIQPSELQIASLVERSGILFIYAATIVRYIGPNNPRKNPNARLETLLGSSAVTRGNHNKEIDGLYALILQAAFDYPDLEDEERDDIRLVLNTVLCAQEPLTADALARFLKLGDTKRVISALQPLWSVLHICEESDLVTTFHASFPDYMFDATRSKEYFCDATACHLSLSHLCFDCIDRAPGFNICGLESSFLPGSRVADLDARVQKAIPAELFYACRHWAAHLNFAGDSPDLPRRLEGFLSARLLIWMEVMNLKKNIHAGVKAIQMAESWATHYQCSTELTLLAHDAWRFAATFAMNPVSQSTPHIYVSMLPFWHESSPISKSYSKYTNNMIKVGGTAIASRRRSLLATWSFPDRVASTAFSPDGTTIALAVGNTIVLIDASNGRKLFDPLEGHSQEVRSVAFSPDGTRVVSASYDKTIRIWDSRNGQLVLGPLKGHNWHVTSAEFSPDGTRVVSGSDDKTICVWDAQTGQMALGPLKGHTNNVTSVQFSPNGTRILSCSYDKTIRIWDARTGAALLDPLEGHAHKVTSARFSPDGNYIVSGSADATVCAWDASSGRICLGPLEGHTDQVATVAFSARGTQIISGSLDGTVLVRDARSGELILGPLMGHTAWVRSVSPSPDGTRIISGSGDRTVCVWDAQSPEVYLDSLDGHTSSVTSVSFSHDGTHIVSGSNDMTVRMWNAQTGDMVLGPLEGHTSFIRSVDISRDGTRIVSGAADAAIRVWDTQSGNLVLGPLKGHTAWVRSVRFSPDGARIVSASHDETICFWDANSGDILLGPLKGHSHRVYSAEWSPDGAHVVSGSADSTIRIWDTQTGETILGPLNGHADSVTSAVFSPDGSLIASGSVDKTIRLWDSRKGNMLFSSHSGHSDAITSISFSSDGTRVASASNDKHVGCWIIQQGELFPILLSGHKAPVMSVAFSPDGTRIVSGSADKTIRVHNVRNTRLPESCPPLDIDWELNDDGWVTDEQSRLLVWVPRDLHSALMRPDTKLLISTEGYARLDFSCANLGELWTKYFHYD